MVPGINAFPIALLADGPEETTRGYRAVAAPIHSDRLLTERVQIRYRSCS